jgi:predicted metalloprotease
MKVSRRGVFATLAIVVVVAMILGLDPGGIVASGHANAAKPGAQTTLPSAARGSGVEAPFDYFPDHYVNQAKEPAEPIATF